VDQLDCCVTGVHDRRAESDWFDDAFLRHLDDAGRRLHRPVDGASGLYCDEVLSARYWVSLFDLLQTDRLTPRLLAGWSGEIGRAFLRVRCESFCGVGTTQAVELVRE